MKTSIEIDEFLMENEEFWNHLEYHCVRECCGIDAFNLEREYFLEIIEYYNKAQILENMNSIIDKIENSALKQVRSGFFNLNENKEVFKQRLLNVIPSIVEESH
ncbi:DUF6331 family protein [Psychroserpens sp. MEBiC05023]